MTALIDLWRAVDAQARLLHGEEQDLRRAVRGVARTRAVPPHLPASLDGELLVVDGATLGPDAVRPLLAALPEAGLAPSAVMVGGLPDGARIDAEAATQPLLLSERSTTELATDAGAYLDDERGVLARVAGAIRLAAAEAALADPTLAAPAGLVAARLRRGVAVAVGDELRSLNPRTAGVALAARFAATHARLLATGHGRRAGSRRTRDGVWLLEQPIQPGASLWLFDDLPFARIDATAAEALAITLRALLRRPTPPAPSPAPPSPSPQTTRRPAGDPLTETLLAVALANGRVAPAARALGVHRNTVLYRLRVARAERGLDPRRPEDALRLLREHEGA